MQISGRRPRTRVSRAIVLVACVVGATPAAALATITLPGAGPVVGTGICFAVALVWISSLVRSRRGWTAAAGLVGALAMTLTVALVPTATLNLRGERVTAKVADLTITSDDGGTQYRYTFTKPGDESTTYGEYDGLGLDYRVGEYVDVVVDPRGRFGPMPADEIEGMDAGLTIVMSALLTSAGLCLPAVVDGSRRRRWWVSWPGMLFGLCSLLVSVAFLILSVRTILQDGLDANLTIGLLLFGSWAVATVLVAFRPNLELTDRQVIVHNPLRTYRIDLRDLTEVGAGYWGIGLVTRGSDDVVFAWAVQKSNLARWLGSRTRADEVVQAIETAMARTAVNDGRLIQN